MCECTIKFIQYIVNIDCSLHTRTVAWRRKRDAAMAVRVCASELVTVTFFLKKKTTNTCAHTLTGHTHTRRPSNLHNAALMYSSVIYVQLCVLIGSIVFVHYYIIRNMYFNSLLRPYTQTGYITFLLFCFFLCSPHCRNFLNRLLYTNALHWCV